MNLKNFIEKANIFQIVLFVIAVIALVFVFDAIGAAIFMAVVNWVARLFSLGFVLTYWQSFGIYLLLSIVGGFFKSTSSKQWLTKEIASDIINLSKIKRGK